MSGLPILALVVTAGHFIVVFVFPFVVVRLPKLRWTPSGLRVSYEDGRDILRDILMVCTRHDFAVSRVRVERDPEDHAWGTESSDNLVEAELTDRHPLPKRVVTVALEVQGTRSIAKLAAKITDIPGVISVNATDVNVPAD